MAKFVNPDNLKQALIAVKAYVDQLNAGVNRMSDNLRGELTIPCVISDSASLADDLRGELTIPYAVSDSASLADDLQVAYETD
jgi:hypothetical protein